MKLTSRTFASLLAVLLILPLAACGKNAESNAMLKRFTSFLPLEGQKAGFNDFSSQLMNYPNNSSWTWNKREGQAVEQTIQYSYDEQGAPMSYTYECKLPLKAAEITDAAADALVRRFADEVIFYQMGGAPEEFALARETNALEAYTAKTAGTATWRVTWQNIAYTVAVNVHYGYIASFTRTSNSDAAYGELVSQMQFEQISKQYSELDRRASEQYSAAAAADPEHAALYSEQYSKYVERACEEYSKVMSSMQPTAATNP